MNPGNQIWILLAFVALSFLQWLIRRLTEQSAINRKKQAEARRREEVLRTGRDPDEQSRRQQFGADAAATEAAARQARLRELRQKQLEEMRRKGQPRPAPSGQVRVPPRAPTQAPGRSAPIVIGPGPASRPAQTRPQRQTIGGAPMTRSTPTQPTPPARRPEPPPAQAQQRSRNLPATSARPAGTEAPPPPRRTRPAAAPGALRDTTTPQSLAATPLISEIPGADAPGVASAMRAIGAGMTAADWRRAFILGEVLAPPVSLRSDR